MLLVGYYSQEPVTLQLIKLIAQKLSRIDLRKNVTSIKGELKICTVI